MLSVTSSISIPNQLFFINPTICPRYPLVPPFDYTRAQLEILSSLVVDFTFPILSSKDQIRSSEPPPLVDRCDLIQSFGPSGSAGPS